MRWDHAHGLRRLYFPALEAFPGFFHGICAPSVPNLSRVGPLFNLGLGCGTPDAKVWHNRKRMLSSFGSRINGVYARQVHGKAMGVWNGEAGPGPEGAGYVDGDALITSESGQALVIQVADCQPVIIVDPVRRVVANVHSGWRGSAQNIIGATVMRMVDAFRCRARDLVCAVGPSLGPCCAEFVHYARELPQAIWPYRRSGDLFDFWKLSADQLIATGVRPENIHISRICTLCNQHLFYSYRGERQTGRFAAIVGIHAGSDPSPD